MTTAEWAIGRSLRLILAVLLATASDSPAQEDAGPEGVRIIWEGAFDGAIRHRRYANGSEPDVGLSFDVTRSNPVRMVATLQFLYLLDADGNIARSVSLLKEKIPEDVEKEDSRRFAREYATTAPNGDFYIIQTSVSSGYTKWTDRLRAFNADGSLRFELLAEESVSGLDERIFIAPNGEYFVIFDSGWVDSPMRLDFYDASTGAPIRYLDHGYFVQQEFSPVDLEFSENGSMVILNGFKTEDLLVFDAQGNFLRRILGEVAAKKKKAVRQERNAIKRKLEPKAVKARLQRGYHTGGIAEFGLLRDRNLGMYSRGDTLYLFTLANIQGETQDEPR